MARSLAGKPNVVAPGGNYPFGRVKDNPGDHTGTNANENLFGDLIQFFEKLMSLGGVTANGQPENSSSGFQYITALLNTVLNTIGMGAGNAIDYSGDLQSLTQPGFYFAELAASNKPVATTGDVVFFKFSINEQFLIFLSSNGKFYYNIKTGFPSAWLGWTCLNDVASNKVDKGGDSMTGDLDFGNSHKVTGIANGSSGNDAVNKTQLDAVNTTASGAATAAAAAAASAATKVAKGGDSMTGPLVSSSTGEFDGGIRTQNSGPYFKKIRLPIGDWNMNSTSNLNVAHGLTFSKIMEVDVMIIPDSGSGLDVYPLDYNDGGGALGSGGVFSWDGTNIKLTRISTGIFDSSNYDATSFNRGYITIVYEA